MATTEPVQFNPLAPETIEDPYPLYHRLRTEDPVHQSPAGIWVLSRYDDVGLALRDARFGRRGFQELITARFGGPGFGNSMLLQDPPDHTRLRTLVSKAFTPRAIEGLRAQIVSMVDGLLDQAGDRGEMDLIADLAYPLPASVICEMLGVPLVDRDRLREWSADIARSLDALIVSEPELITRAKAAGLALREYFEHLVGERRRAPRADILSALIAAEEAGDQLSTDELFATVVLLFLAGHETTANLIGNGVLALLRHPAELARLRDDPSLVESAVEELLRYDSPVQRVSRITSADVVINDHTIPRGSLVLALIASANRDPAYFPEPDRLDLARRDNRHLAFGSGIHFCLGAPLARLEGRIVLAALLRRCPRLALATDRVEWRQTFALRALVSLPVRF
ncbi:MAG: cytochrome P450 [Candidatus Rokuibacteriota bacterium]|nr:MAG: cytochrome P450 [Candidatus Rokubacteria bacterium]